MAVSAIRIIMDKARGQGVSKAQGEAKCFIGIEAACQMFYFMYSKS